MGSPNLAFAQNKNHPDRDKLNAKRADHVRELNNKNINAHQRVKKWSNDHKKATRHETGNNLTELVDIKNGRPIYLTTHNLDASISTAANSLKNPATWNLDGSGLTIGLWDAGSALATHQEFGSRLTIKDDAESHYHSTHVAGTLGASGFDAAAIGMAPGVQIASYNWGNDSTEMAALAAAFPDDTDKIFVSNHSYGYVAGWQWANWAGTNGWHWNSAASWNDADSVDYFFGQYDASAKTFDSIAYNYPCYLIFKSSGNDRGDAPALGQTIYYSTNFGGSWLNKKYDSITCPPGDDQYKNGYDTIPTTATAKNIMVVGAVNDAVSDGTRSLSNATMTNYSSWGPTDDGRIKPDIVANGQNLKSAHNSSPTAYATLSGTSMATPNACGSAILLIQLYKQLFPEHAMTSSTLKALIIHTADDLGNTGPDYQNGWGLMNTLTAAELIQRHHDVQDKKNIIESILTDTNRMDTYSFQSDGISPARFTLCWTDPPGDPTTSHDSTIPQLVNDLDLRITDPDNETCYLPWILDPADPTANAFTGDNTRDNVEQIDLPTLPAGTWQIQVGFKNALANNRQTYSLITSFSVANSPPKVFDATVITLTNTTIPIELLASDDKSPSPLTWTITTIPQNGFLTDPADPGTPITSVPYTLANNKNVINYTTNSQTTASDQFVFVANDSGTPPTGGDSNPAVITLDIMNILFNETFDENPNWSTEGDWQFGPPLGISGNYGNPDPTAGVSGDNVYGYNLAGNYANNMPAYNLQTPAINCSNYQDVTLSFFRWLNVEQSSYDRAGLQVSNDNVNWTTIWENTTETTEITDNQWTPATYDISHIADTQPTVYIRWVMGNTDSSWEYSGWNIDDVTLLGHHISIPSPTLLPEPLVTTTPCNTITWDPLPNAGGYLAQIANDPDFADIVTTGTWTSETEYEFCQLISGQTYYYRLKARLEDRPDIESPWSPVLSSRQCHTTADFNHNCLVELVDLQEIAILWLKNDCSELNNWCDTVDLNQDTQVNLSDLAAFSIHWLQP